jgi:tetratricopeptide (TPR) repeat protein
VFEGGASVEAAESVLASLNAETSAPPLDLLEHLVDQSLLVIGTTEAGEPRLRMLETVREYAVEQLTASDADGLVHGAHVRYFLDWIDAMRTALKESRDSTAVRSVRGELDNLRGAIAWLKANDDDGSRLRLVNALFPYWRIAGPYTEAGEELAAALETVGEGDLQNRADALSALGWLAGAHGDFAASIDLNTRALALLEELGDRKEQAETLWLLATAAEFLSNYRGAREYHQRRIPLTPEDDALGRARIENDLGRLALIEGNFDEAIALISEALAVFRSHAETQLLAYGLIDLTSAEMISSRAESSLAHIKECVMLLRTLDDDYALAVAVVTQGRAEQLAGNHEAAQKTLERSLEDAERLGDANLRSLALYGLGVSAAARGWWEEAAGRLRAAFAVSQGIGDHRRIAEILDVTANVQAGMGNAQLAAQLLGRASLEREESATSVPPAHQARYDWTVDQVLIAMGHDQYERLFAQGRTMDSVEIIEQIST